MRSHILLRACRACHCHFHTSELSCPHCGAKHSPLPSAASVGRGLALAVGLALVVGCPGDKYGGADSGWDSTTCEDVDQDGYDDEECGGTDCDDDDETINPAATETSGDGVDSNCDGEDDT